LNNALKILQVVPCLGRGGAERLVTDISNELSSRGADVTIINLRDSIGYNLNSVVKRKVISARYIPSLIGKPVSELAEYRDFVSRLKPDIVHSHLFAAEIITRQVLLTGAAYFTHLHDNMPQFRNFSPGTLLDKSKLVVFYEKKLMIRQYRKCRNNFIAISNDTADYFNRCLPLDLRQRMTTLNNAIKVDRFMNSNRKTLAEPYRLVTTGNLVDKKNHTFLVDVVKILSDKGIRVHLDIVGGEGPNWKKIQSKIDDFGMRAHITMQGNVERVEDYLHQAHIYVHAATYEPFGLAIIEAMAAGLPCVMLDGRGNRDITEEGKNGFLITENSPQIFAERLERLIRNPKLYEDISKYAAAFAKKFDIKEYVTKLLSYYRGALDNLRPEK